MKKYNIKKGGSVLGSGGFGCIFSPALKCENELQEQNENKITKLMKKKYADEEYDDLIQFKPFIEKIPNYEDYFLMKGFSLCKPDKLTESDLDKYDKKCSALKKNKITSDNINKSLDELLALNMPYGGINVGDYIDDIVKNKSKSEVNKLLISLNKKLIALFKNGIIPMNELGIYHNDIKESNILVDDKLYTRIIDWGLSTKYDSDSSKKVPDVMDSRPFQYNTPFSSILFNEVFDKMYNEFLIKNPHPEKHDIRAFVVNYIFVWNECRGQGHLKTINELFEKYFKKYLYKINEKDIPIIIELEFTYTYITEYLTNILHHYTHDGKINIIDYFNEIYLKIVDVWGFLIVYVPFLEYFENENEEAFNLLKNIFFKYLYESRLEPINNENLIKDLDSLNNIIERNHNSLFSSLKKSSIKTKTTTRKSSTKKSTSKKTRKSTEKYNSLENGDVEIKLLSEIKNNNTKTKSKTMQ